MPPQGGSKRKRGDRTYSEDDVTRPSPYRPHTSNFAKHPESPTYARNGPDNRGRGNRRGSRGGRNTYESNRFYQQNSSEAQGPVTKGATQNLNGPEPTPVVARTMPDSSIAPPTPAEPPSVFRPYTFVHLSREVCEDWQTIGRSMIQSKVEEFIQLEDEVTTLGVIQELIQCAVSGMLTPKEAGEVLKPLLASQTETRTFPLENVVLDALSIAYEDNQTLQRAALVEFVLATGIEEDVLRQEFDQDLLQKLGMIRSTFGRMGIRKQTNVLYRQANFNLMREESEGFAKLMTELFTTSGNEPPTGEVVENAVEHVKAMIGAFDLDVGRSLDVVLDVFGAVLVKQFRFFVKFLRASPWWPRTLDSQIDSKELGGLPLWARPGNHGWKLTAEEEAHVHTTTRERDDAFWPEARKIGLRAFQQIGRTVASAEDMQRAREADSDELAEQWILETGTLPIPANRDAAQLLGFKLRFYSSSTAKDPSDTLPDHLIYLSALLIKIGFISLNDLYPHIWRSDEEMEELRLQKLKEKAERERAARPGAGARNALLMAGALADDTLPAPSRLRDAPTRSGTPAKEAEAEKSVVKEPTPELIDQKVTLLKSLLAIGALPEALFILGRFPWILELYPEASAYVHRILHYSLSEMSANLRPLRSRSSLTEEKPFYETDIPGIVKGQVRLTEPPQKRVLRWAQLDRDDSNDGTDYRFYWDEWNDNIPICRNVEDVFTLCQTILPLVGVKIGQDPALVLKLTRIGKNSIQQDPSEYNKERWLNLIKRVLLPCLSLTKPNAGVVNEVFDFLSTYPTSVRYVLYLEWSSGRISRNADVKAAFDQAKAETKDTLKRISKTNVKPMARSLAKIAYANPHVVITTALAQIEVYDSIAEVFVEGSRYFTDLGYDVLNWALISSMARAGRSRTQDGGIFTSRWLSALSQFAGKIYKRYSMMKPGPVLQYVAEQLEKGNSTDLKMLEQIVAAMAGIAIDTSFNDAQLQAMGGGPLLQSQTIMQLLDRRNDSKTSARRLVKALQDHGLLTRFLVSMAQQRQACVFDDANVPLKAIGNTFDEIGRIMYQYLDLLRSNLSAEDFQRAIPDITYLLIDYEIPADIAFWFARPILARQMTDMDKDQNSQTNTIDIKKPSIDVDMKDPESSEEDGEAVETEEITTPAATPNDAELNDMIVDDVAPPSKDKPARWHPVLKAIMDQIGDHLPAEIIDTIGVGFYVTFWQLSLYDISVPSKSYEDEMNRQRKKITSITSDRTNVSVHGAKLRENTVRQYQQLIDDLLAENKDHLKAYSENRSRLQKEKDQWFADKQRHSKETNTALMEHCFLPRILSSPQDAFFCFKFVKFLHSNATPNFRTLGFYESLMKADRLTSLFFMCTSNESDNLGRFLCELLRDLGRWHKDKHVYEREAFGSKKNLPGFATKVENGKPHTLFDFENFRRIVHKWHSNVFSALAKCFDSAEYMHIRNAISILRAVSPVFPVVTYHGNELHKAVTKLGENEREDIQVASAALKGALQRREKEWVTPQAFRERPGSTKLLDQKSKNVKPDKALPNGGGVEEGEEGETGEIDSKEVLAKAEVPEKASSDIVSKPSPRPPPSESIRERSRPAAPDAHIPSRPLVDATNTARRGNRPVETNRSHDLPRKLSPTRHQPSPSLPNRPEIESGSSHRDSPRPSTRPIQAELPRPDSRASHSRYGPHDRTHEATYEQPPRHSRPHDRSGLAEREERSARRDHDMRHGYEDRLRPERDNRLERDARSEHPRAPERDSRMLDRDISRPHYEATDRKRPERPDLLDDRRSTPSATSRSVPTPPVAAQVNPERAALIHNVDQRTGMSIRGQAQDKSKHSRASSPRRDEERRPRGSDREDRSDRSERAERPDRADRTERSEHVERPDRSERHGRLDRYDRSDRPERPERNEGSERSERPERSDRSDRRPDENAQQGPAVQSAPNARSGGSNNFAREPRSYNQPQIDMQHGRLEPESPSRPSPRERVLPEDTPSGPRSRPSNGPRRGPPSGIAPVPTPPQVPSVPPPLPASVPERPTPTGPSKQTRTNPSYEPQPSAPASDTSGVHPDRMNLVAPQETSRPPQRPPPVNTQVSIPSGPRNGQVAPPSGPSPIARGAPMGPQEGAGRGRRHPLATVNNTLAQASGPGGRGGRNGSRQGNSFPSTAQSPVQGPRTDFNQPDPSNPNGMPVQARPQSGRRESGRDMRGEDDGWMNRNRHEGKESGRNEEPRRNERRDESHRDQRGYRGGPEEEMPPRKHHRQDSGQYSGIPSRGGRNTGDNKRPRRGG